MDTHKSKSSTSKSAKLSVKEVISDSYQLFISYWKFLFTAGLFTIFITAGVQLIGSAPSLFGVNESAPILLFIIFYLIASAVGFTFQVGWIVVGMKMVRKKQPTIKDLWTDPMRIFRFWIVSFAYSFIVVLGFLFFVIPGFYLLLKYNFATWLVADQNMGVKKAFGESARITQGKKGALLWISLGVMLVLYIPVLLFLFFIFLLFNSDNNVANIVGGISTICLVAYTLFTYVLLLLVQPVIYEKFRIGKTDAASNSPSESNSV